MSGELLIRPALNDHEVVSDLLAPGGTGIMVGRQRPLISRLVVDAPVAARRPQFAEAAAGAGIPFLVDPLTPLLHGVLRDEDPWARLPFGRAGDVAPAEFAARSDRDHYVAEVVEFELSHSATAVIPPYPYVSAPDDPWFLVALDWIRLTRTAMERDGVAVPLVPVLCAQLMKMGAEKAWNIGLDRFASAARDAGAQAVGLCLSPAGDGKDSYHKLWRLFLAMSHLKIVLGLPVIAWRQGIYGPALVAAGVDGYETGIGISEQSNIRSNIAARRPPKPGKKPGRGGAAGVFVEPLGRSLNPRVARRLLENQSMRAKVMCTDERCCPQGVASTLEHPREHAVRSRARELATLGALPARPWRLNHIAMKAQAAVTLAQQANRLLANVGEPLQIKTTSLEALARVAEELRRAESEGRNVA
jgi:hypothetical protein